MKNINYYNQKLEKLQAQKKALPSVKNMSIAQFIRYKKIDSKEKKLCFLMEKNLALGNEINFWYSTQNKSWIENPNISAMKYCKLERNATYKKDLKLYKLGLIDKKPLHPVLEKLAKFFSPVKNILKESFHNFKKTISKYNFFKIIHKKIVYFKSNTLPQKFNHLAVSTATAGIKGYKRLQANCRYIRNTLASKDSFKYIKNVINEAHHIVENSESSKENYPKEEENNTFRENIKLENFISNTDNFNNYRPESISINPTYLAKPFNRKLSSYKYPHAEKSKCELSR